MKKLYPEPYRRGESKIYYFHLEENGKRRQVSTGKINKEEARAEIRRRVDSAAAVRPAAGVLTFKEYSAPYYRWEADKAPTCPHAARLVAEGKIIGRQHCVTSRRLLDRVLEEVPAFGNLTMETIRRAHIVDLRATLMATHTPNSCGKLLEAVKTVLAEAGFREDIAGTPGARVGKPTYTARVRGSFSAAEVRALLKAKPGRMGSEPRIEALLTVLFATGARAGEIRALRWGAVDLATRACRIDEAAKGEKGTETGLPKWGKVRAIVLPVLAVNALEAWKAEALRTAPDDFIFGGADGRLPSHQVLKDAWASLIDAATVSQEGAEPLLKAGERWLTPHSCRHTVNSILLASGASPLAVAEYLGWSSEVGRALSSIQARYTHLELIDLRKVADAIDTAYSQAAPSNIVQFA
jgi:integrase